LLRFFSLRFALCSLRFALFSLRFALFSLRFALLNFEKKVRFVRFASLFCSLRFASLYGRKKNFASLRFLNFILGDIYMPALTPLTVKPSTIIKTCRATIPAAPDRIVQIQINKNLLLEGQRSAVEFV
jgi:hypothetical protein